MMFIRFSQTVMTRFSIDCYFSVVSMISGRFTVACLCLVNAVLHKLRLRHEK